MNLKCVFHVSPAIGGALGSSGPSVPSPKIVAAPEPPMRPRMPSLLDLDIEWVDQPEEPRGRSYETWQRARGWASED